MTGTNGNILIGVSGPWLKPVRAPTYQTATSPTYFIQPTDTMDTDDRRSSQHTDVLKEHRGKVFDH